MTESRYHNRWASFEKLTPSQLLRSISISRPSCLGPKSTSSCEEVARIPQVKPTTFAISPPIRSIGDTCSAPRVTWLGHASVYLQLPPAQSQKTQVQAKAKAEAEAVAEDNVDSDWKGILFDPVFSKRCSPSKMFGPKRRVDPPCSIEDLPRVDMVFISHDHYDHLDKSSIRGIEEHHRDAHYYVPTGLKETLESFGVPSQRITEMGWWEKTAFDFGSNRKTEMQDENVIAPASTHPHSAKLPGDGSIRIVCCPAQHNSGRSLFDKNKTLWATWLIESDSTSTCFFGGDTGYRSVPDGPTCPVFSEIKAKYGSPDLALLPTSYGSVLPYLKERLPFLSFDGNRMTASIHCSPSNAVDVHKELGARMSIPIHWGTWTTESGAEETVRDLTKACRHANIPCRWDDQDEVVSCPEETADFDANEGSEVAKLSSRDLNGFVISDIGSTVICP
uniref:Metallo-beta-lactamase domain-containing protein n=1 Tax=Kwoniella dejecticola CBS 10117 TaxID=1296121 RepID=A0A1A6ACV3_9TREE|nr:uncharacterized protein I303_02099 [Kwoniella dejecticola CBS 10117]OBR87885.1 hypothetical protein I303_02099 [Kwoniella dejecticola CBS 10117]